MLLAIFVARSAASNTVLGAASCPAACEASDNIRPTMPAAETGSEAHKSLTAGKKRDTSELKSGKAPNAG